MDSVRWLGTTRSSRGRWSTPTPRHQSAPAFRVISIPIDLIARLAVATTHQGHGLGTDLARDAFTRILSTSEQGGIRAVFVHAVDQHAASFYQQLGFEPATPDGRSLMVPLAAARSMIGRAR